MTMIMISTIYTVEIEFVILFLD